MKEVSEDLGDADAGCREWWTERQEWREDRNGHLLLGGTDSPLTLDFGAADLGTKWLSWSHRWAGLGAGGGRPPVLVSFCLLSSPDQWEKVLFWTQGYGSHLTPGPGHLLQLCGCGTVGGGSPVPVPPLIPCSCSLAGKGTSYFEWAPGFQPGNMKWLSQGLAMGYASRTRAASAEGGPGWGGNSRAMEEVGQKRASDDRVGLSPVCIDCRVGGRRGQDKAGLKMSSVFPSWPL